MKKIFLSLAAIAVAFAQSPTIDSGRQFNGTMDASGATVTKPSRTVGSDQSGACSSNNEVVINSANGKLFGCIAGTWMQLGGSGSGASSVSQLTDLYPTGVGTATLTSGSGCAVSTPCNFDQGAFTNAVTATPGVTSSGTAYWYVDRASGFARGLVVNYTAGSTMTAGGAGVLNITTGTDYPATEHVKIATCTFVTGSWTGCVDRRSAFNFGPRVTGSGVTWDGEKYTIPTGGGSSYDPNDMTVEMYTVQWGLETPGTAGAGVLTKYGTNCGGSTTPGGVSAPGEAFGQAMYIATTGSASCTNTYPGSTSIYDFASGGTPKTWQLKHRGGRTNDSGAAAGVYYVGICQSQNDFNNFVGARYVAGSTTWQAAIINGGSATTQPITGSTSTDTAYSFTVENLGVANSVKVSVGANNATVAATIPVGNWHACWGSSNASANNNTASFAHRTRLKIQGVGF
jgi:hypothetical protein